MVRREPFVAPVPGPGILEALRQETAGRHARIESLLELHKPFGRARYGRVLQGFEAFLAGWEPAMAAALPPRLQDWLAQGRRHALLREDLAALGLPVLAAPVGAAPLDDLPQALGSLYVLEGSALGGQVIAAQARRCLGLAPGPGTRWFHGCGAGTAARWRAFGALLSTELADDAAGRERAVQSAAATFDALLGLFQILLHERAAA